MTQELKTGLCDNLEGWMGREVRIWGEEDMSGMADSY